MRKYFALWGIMFLFTAFSAHSQEEESSKRFAYRSFSISPFGFYVASDGGFAFNADISFDYGQNIFSLGLGAGAEISIMGPGDDYSQINLLYGRQFSFNPKVVLEMYGGAGYFMFNTYGTIDSDTREKGDIRKTTVGIPIGAKLRFYLGPQYSMGLQLQANINSAESIGTLGLVLQWNRKRK